MKQRILDLTLRVGDERIEVDVYDNESGEIKQIDLPFSPDEHPEFDKQLGDEIYSWLSLMEEEDE